MLVYAIIYCLLKLHDYGLQLKKNTVHSMEVYVIYCGFVCAHGATYPVQGER